VASLGGSVSDYVPRSVQKRLLAGESGPEQRPRG